MAADLSSSPTNGIQLGLMGACSRLLPGGQRDEMGESTLVLLFFNLFVIAIEVFTIIMQEKIKA